MNIKKNLIWSLIPAKSNSKRVPKKNLKKIDGINLFLYSCVFSKMHYLIKRTFVSTDSKIIKRLAISFSAEVPFLRPKNISKNFSQDYEYVHDFLSKIKKKEKFLPEFIIQLRPTTPFRSIQIINKAIKKIKLFPKSTSLRSCHIADHPPEKQFRIKNNYYCDINLKKINNEKFNIPSQNFKYAYEPNGYVDILKTSYLLKNKKRIYGHKILPLVTKKTLDIDTIEDFQMAQKSDPREKKIILKEYYKIKK